MENLLVIDDDIDEIDKFKSSMLQVFKMIDLGLMK